LTDIDKKYLPVIKKKKATQNQIKDVLKKSKQDIDKHIKGWAKEKIYEDRINEHIKMKDLMENIANHLKEFQNKLKELNEKITSLANKYQELMDQVTEMEVADEENMEKGKKEEEMRKKLKDEMEKRKKKCEKN